jgi:uracil-DNA glycosylase
MAPTSPKEIFHHWEQASEGKGSDLQHGSTGTNMCDGCSRNDRDNVCRPYFGYGSLDADVLILGEAPGGNETGEGIPLLGEESRRIWKDFREVTDEDFSEYQKTSPDDLPRDINDANNFGDWRIFVEEFRYAFCKELDRCCEFYYTNSAKCSDIHPSEEIVRATNSEKLNERGKDRCLAWLREEIEYIDPEVLLVFNKQKVNQVKKIFDALEVGRSGSFDNFFNSVAFDVQDKANPANTYESQIDNYDFTIVCSPHFTSRGWGSIRGAEGKTVWTKEGIDESVLGYPERYDLDKAGGLKKAVASALARAAVNSV